MIFEVFLAGGQRDSLTLSGIFLHGFCLGLRKSAAAGCDCQRKQFGKLSIYSIGNN